MKRIIIIGATSGIGRELATLYATAGNLVGITGRRSTLLDSLQRSFPENIRSACFDAGEHENLAHLQRLVEDLGGLDLLIYNAGFGELSPGLKWEIEEQTIQTNVSGFTRIAGFAFNYFAHQGRGQIALTSSVASLRGNSWAPAYSASKAYMSNYAEGLNIKAGRLGKDIVVTDVRPGFVDTKEKGLNRRFWVAPVDKAAIQIMDAIAKKKRIAYITKRWFWVARVLQWLPFAIYRRIG